MFTSEALHSVWFALLERPFADWLSTPRMRSATQRPGTAQSEIMTVGSTYRLRARFACHEVNVALDRDVVQQRLLFRLVFSLEKQSLINPFRTHVRSLITGIATTQQPAKSAAASTYLSPSPRPSHANVDWHQSCASGVNVLDAGLRCAYVGRYTPNSSQLRLSSLLIVLAVY